jgi:arginase
MGTSVAIVGAPLDLGQGRRGVDMGPSAIRYGGLEERLRAIGCTVVDMGNVVVPALESLTVADPTARYLPEILETCVAVSGVVEHLVRDGVFPLVLGGDHSVAMGTLSGVAAAAGRPGGVVWIDAHADLNTPGSSPSGNVHGMSLAAALGLAGNAFASGGLTVPSLDPARVAIVGARSLDPGEQRYLRDSGIRVLSMSEIDRIGIERAMQEALDRASGPGFVHVSFDLDVIDPDVAPGVGTPVRGGLTYREAHLACELIAESAIVGSLEVVEANPVLDRANTTALTAVELIVSLLGKTIL